LRELRITDTELQEMIGTALRERLRKAGFRHGTPSDDLYAFNLPITLDLAGTVYVRRTEDGVWTITQEEDAIMERLAEAGIAFAEAVGNSANRPS
jgi:hypothetical protein